MEKLNALTLQRKSSAVAYLVRSLQSHARLLMKEFVQWKMLTVEQRLDCVGLKGHLNWQTE